MLSADINATALPHSRRDVLRAGGGLVVAAGSLGRSWGANSATSPAASRGQVPGGRARTCILVYLLGGPPHQDMFDLKLHAPAEVRGPFQPIATNVPGLEICEHLPRLARCADKFALVRSVSHRNSNHTPMIYYTLTGRETAQPLVDNDIRPPQPGDFPHMGAVLSRLCSRPVDVPGYVALPELAIRSSLRGEFKRARSPLRGGAAGFLGPQCDPLAVNGEPGSLEAIPALTLPAEIPAERFQRRVALLSLLDDRGPSSRLVRLSRDLHDQAVLLTGAANTGGLRAFSLDGEADAVRDRYGRHRFGQSMLLARRLAAAGVPMVAVHFNEMTVCDGWDTHSGNFQACQSELLPMLDQSLSALLGDLSERGLLETTLVQCFGEFGRTPRINANAGRDHWGDCSTTLLAGGGIRGGRVIGASDRLAAYPVTRPIDPVDLQATAYHCLHIDPHTVLYDPLARPWPISTGQVVQELL